MIPPRFDAIRQVEADPSIYKIFLIADDQPPGRHQARKARPDIIGKRFIIRAHAGSQVAMGQSRGGVDAGLPQRQGFSDIAKDHVVIVGNTFRMGRDPAVKHIYFPFGK